MKPQESPGLLRELQDTAAAALGAGRIAASSTSPPPSAPPKGSRFYSAHRRCQQDSGRSQLHLWESLLGWECQPRMLQATELLHESRTSPFLLQGTVLGGLPWVRLQFGSPGLALVPSLSRPGSPEGLSPAWQLGLGTHREEARRAQCPEP